MIKKNIYYLFCLSVSVSMEPSTLDNTLASSFKNTKQEKRNKLLGILKNYNTNICNIEKFWTNFLQNITDNKTQFEDENVPIQCNKVLKLISCFQKISSFLIQAQEIINDGKNKKDEGVLLNELNGNINLYNYIKAKYSDFF